MTHADLTALVKKFVDRCAEIRNGSPNQFYAHVDASCKQFAALLAQREAQPATPGGRDEARLIAQAHAIEAILRDAGVGACPLPEGVRRLTAERDRLIAAMQSQGYSATYVRQTMEKDADA